MTRTLCIRGQRLCRYVMVAFQSSSTHGPNMTHIDCHTTRTTSITTDLAHASRPPQPTAMCTSSSRDFRYNNTTSSHRQQRKQEPKQTQGQSLTLTSTSTSCTTAFELDSSRRACDKSVKLPRHTHYAMLPLHGQWPMARRGWLGICPPEMSNQLPVGCGIGWLSAWLDG